jgi:hypothetical protein
VTKKLNVTYDLCPQISTIHRENEILNPENDGERSDDLEISVAGLACIVVIPKFSFVNVSYQQ